MTQPTNTKIKTIPFDAKIDITVGGGLYARVSQFIQDWGSQKPIEEFTAILERLKTEEPKDAFEYHLVTLLSIVIEIEEKATAQGKVVERDLSELDPPKS